MVFKSLYHKQRKGSLDSLYNANSIYTSLLSSLIKVSAYSKVLTKITDYKYFIYNRTNKVPYN